MSYSGGIKTEGAMKISPDFMNHTSNAKRVSFQFSAAGLGVLYVTMNVEGNPMPLAEKAAKIAAKRANGPDLTLHAIVAPMR